MAWVGQSRAAARTVSSDEPFGSSTIAMLSSSSWNAPGAAYTQLPEPMHKSRSISTSMATSQSYALARRPIEADG